MLGTGLGGSRAEALGTAEDELRHDTDWRRVPDTVRTEEALIEARRVEGI